MIDLCGLLRALHGNASNHMEYTGIYFPELVLSLLETDLFESDLKIGLIHCEQVLDIYTSVQYKQILTFACTSFIENCA